MDYKEKLKEFNSKEKYKTEMDLMIRFISNHKYALDYGCGTGFMSDYINRNTLTIVKSFDVNDYAMHNLLPIEESDLFGCIFLNHSFAHINLDILFFNKIKSLLVKGGEIIINTPNKKYLEFLNNNNYTPDITVLSHYTQEDLVNIFEQNGFKTKFIIQHGQILNGLNERIIYIANYE